MKNYLISTFKKVFERRKAALILQTRKNKRFSMSKLAFLATLIGLFQFVAFAQIPEPENGVFTDQQSIALVNARIVVSADEVIEHGTLVIKDGIVQQVGLAVIPPRDAVKINLKGYTIYPSFIDIYATEGVEKQIYKKPGRRPQLNTLKEGPYYWNQAIHPEVNAVSQFKDDLLKSRETYVKQGFGSISTHVADGIMRGTAVFTTIGERNESQVIQTQSAQHYALHKGSSKQTYPTSQMGAIALIKQFFYDAYWYQKQKSLNPTQLDNLSLDKGLEHLSLPQIFEAKNKLEILRIYRTAVDAGLMEHIDGLIIKGGGDSYERIQEIKETGASLIVPVNFPAPFDMTDPYLSRFVSLATLKDWELRPHNPYILHKNNISFCFTTADLKEKKSFLKNIRKTIEHGLPKEAALRALTENPAKFLRADDQIGTLEAGKIANFLVVKGDIFEDGEIYENWIRGQRKRLQDINRLDIRGTYHLNINKIVYQWKIKGSPEDPKSTLETYVWRTDSLTGKKESDTLKIQPTITFDQLQISMSFLEKEGNYNGVLQLSGTYNPNLGAFHGRVKLPNGEWADWSAIRSEKFMEEKAKEKMVVDTSALSALTYPNMAYGFDTLPQATSYFIKNATIWTNEEVGIVKNGNLLIQDGKIQSVNSQFTRIPNDATIIDATGKHVTCGIIDEHSHIAISKGVNEAGQSITSEVSIGDVVRSNDINIYRQLAGGVTASQLLHGSANPIGGRSALVKLKWGFSPEEMLIDDAPGFIKFALGENVKQSNWGDHNTVRYPQTRMGVEQVFYDAFYRAREYDKKWNAYNALSDKKKSKTTAPRRDLELEVLAEILKKERFVTCHSYIQSEINMLMHVADSMGFTLNTFTHILEGYKVADKMKAHGAGASTFADWWAYKFEVNEAIPYNAAILHKMGIVTAINSDDAEMGRRLNQEAAKVVKYGGISEEDAWKMVTLNPAKLLHLDDRMGSIQEGKDADIVIWSENPLSIHAKAEKTFVDGILLYDINRSVQLHTRDQKERNRIIQKMMEEKKKGAKTRQPVERKNPHYHCDSIEW